MGQHFSIVAILAEQASPAVAVRSSLVRRVEREAKKLRGPADNAAGSRMLRPMYSEIFTIGPAFERFADEITRRRRYSGTA